MPPKPKSRTTSKSEASKAAAKKNPWLLHLKKFRAAHPNITDPIEVVKKAKLTYKR